MIKNNNDKKTGQVEGTGEPVPASENSLGTDRGLSPPREFISVDEWPIVRPEDAAMPELDKAQLIAEVEKLVNKYQALSSWEAKHNVTWRQSSQKQIGRTIPKFITYSQVHTISNGPRWLYQ